MKKFLSNVLLFSLFGCFETLGSEMSHSDDVLSLNSPQQHVWIFLSVAPGAPPLEESEIIQLAMSALAAMENPYQQDEDLNQQEKPLTEDKKEAILKLYEQHKKDSLDPKRPGEDFSDIEKGIAIAITQFVSNSEESFLSALYLIFSEERAKKILKSIAEG